MARTSAVDVKAILENSQLTDPTVEAFIAGATAIVDQVIGDDTTLSDDIKEEIERWLTAHMIVMTVERMAKKEGAGGANIEYTGEFGKQLGGSAYGQMVLTLDTTGKFAIQGGKAASLDAVTSFD